MTTAISNIRVTLALTADGALPEAATASLGQVAVGPHGLLRLLETRLGIPSGDTPFTTRLIQYLGCLDQLDQQDAFYRGSYEADPFSVARTLLQWRDQWYLAGWTGTFAASVPDRLRDMATIEQLAAGSVATGPGQRIQRVIELLRDNPSGIDTITLRDPLPDFPDLWQRLVTATGAALVETGDTPPQADPHSDLGRLQRHLRAASSEKLELRGDGSVMVLRADSPQESTPLTALLIQHWQQRAPDDAIAILAESRGDLLDDALENARSPRLGFTDLSPWRPVFQVLPLACELLWEPLNPTALFQFLSHPVGPIPGRIRERLARTVAATPGIGSEAWRQAVATSLENEDAGERARLRGKIDYWLQSPRFAPRDGVDSATLARRAQKVADWLQGSKDASNDDALKSLYNIALNQALEFVKAIERLKAHGRGLLTRDNVRRLIEDVRGNGAPVTDRGAEVCPGLPRVLRADHAGAFSQPVANVIWWDCQANDRVHRWPWSRGEQAALAANGVVLHGEDRQLDWLGKAWLRPLLCATGRCAFILHDDTERHHPIQDQIASLCRGMPVLPLASAESIARLELTTHPLQARALPPKVRWWQLPGEVSLPVREAESFSSLDAYIHSPYQWLLRYVARIRPGTLTTVNDGNLLKGNLVHRLYQEFFNAQPAIPAIKPRAIPAWVEQHIGSLLQQEGALLLEPGRQAECERFATQLQDSLATLVEHLQSAGVVSVQTELWQEGSYPGGKLNGSIDLLATRADGREAVVDIKWGGRKYRRNALLEGSYLQLATYARLRRENGAVGMPALGYFIASDAHMLSLDHDFFPDAERLGTEGHASAADYWLRFEQSWRWRKAQFDQGRVEVTISNTEPTDESIPADDCLAMPEVSDMFNDYRVLTGWESDA